MAGHRQGEIRDRKGKGLHRRHPCRRRAAHPAPRLRLQRRRCRDQCASAPSRSIFAIVALCAALALPAAPAFATTTHQFSRSFGAAASTPSNPYPLSSPTSVAVDNSSGPSAGDVYVTDPANFRLEKFDSSGNFILMFGQGVDQSNPGNVCTAASGDTCGPGTQDSAPGAFNTPTFVAVDGSSGPSAGDVYVADTGDNLVSKFAPDGSLIGSWSTAGQLGGFGPLAGIAVDTSGDLWVYDQNANMFEYAQDGSLRHLVELQSRVHP